MSSQQPKSAVRFESMSNRMMMDIDFNEVAVLGRGRIGYGNASFYGLWKRSMIVYLSPGHNSRSTVCDIIGVTKSTNSLAVSQDGMCLAVVDNTSISIFCKDRRLASITTESNQIELHSFTTQLSTGFELDHGIVCFTENGYYRVVDVGKKGSLSNQFDASASLIKNGIYNNVCDEFWELHRIEQANTAAWFVRVRKGHVKETQQLKALTTVQHSAFSVGQDGVVSLLVQETEASEQAAAKLTLIVFKPNGTVSATINNIEWPARRLDLFPTHVATASRCFIVSRHLATHSYSRMWSCRDYKHKSANELSNSEALHRFVVLFNGVPAIITHNARDPLWQCGFAFIDLKLIDVTEQTLSRNRAKRMESSKSVLDPVITEKVDESKHVPMEIVSSKSISLAAEPSDDSGTAVPTTETKSPAKEETVALPTDDAKNSTPVSAEPVVPAPVVAAAENASNNTTPTTPASSSTLVEDLLAELDSVTLNADESGTV